MPTTNAMEINEGQKEALTLMLAGWGLGSSGIVSSDKNMRVWLQRPGVGHGDSSKTIEYEVYKFLIDNKLIKFASGTLHVGVAKYVLTPEGKALA